MSSMLALGIKRALFRDNDSSAGVADAEFAALRGKALRMAEYRCVFCGYESPPRGPKGTTNLQVHHADDDHHNNDPSNLKSTCSLDHAAHHIGCDAPSAGGDMGWASQMRVAYLPELSVQDLNLLQRALGAAMKDQQLKDVALECYGLLCTLVKPVADAYGTNKSKDFAAAMGAMSQGEYADRIVDGLRIIFHPDLLKQAGAEMLADNEMLKPKTWKVVADGIRNSAAG